MRESTDILGSYKCVEEMNLLEYTGAWKRQTGGREEDQVYACVRVHSCMCANKSEICYVVLHPIGLAPPTSCTQALRANITTKER